MALKVIFWTLVYSASISIVITDLLLGLFGPSAFTKIVHIILCMASGVWLAMYIDYTSFIESLFED